MNAETAQQTSLTTAQNVRIIVFACKWCGFIGADNAGRERISLTPDFRLIPVDCAASIEPDIVIRALSDGIDGVAICGCHLGGCRHHHANQTASKRLELLQDLFEITGLDRRRLLLSWGTAHEPFQFEWTIHRFQEILMELPLMDRVLRSRSFRSRGL